MKPNIINVSLNDKFKNISYPIFIGNNLLSNCEEILKRFISENGGDFDMIIDDGGHTMEQMQVSLNYLWDELKSGGLYVIEDLHRRVY